MTPGREVSRRDFLRLRRLDRAVVLELSCRAMFMRCADASIVQEPADAWEPWMGEPPAAVSRATVDEIFGAFERDLERAALLRLHEPEWFDALPEPARLQAALRAFVARGGAIEPVGATG